MSVIRNRLSKNDLRRKLFNFAMLFALGVMTLIALLPLLSVFLYTVKQGLPALNFEFFFSLPKPVGEVGGGIGHAILGTLGLVSLASFIGIPVGIAAGMYLAEYGRGKIATTLRFSIDLLASTPSIIVGIFAYAIFVVPFKHFSALAGSLALAVIMIPMIARTSEELLKIVPVHVREAGLGLGIPRWRVILSIVFRGSFSGILTGILLAVARAAGESAPLLFTAFNSQFWPKGPLLPTASIPIQIYTYAISPYDDWHQKAWAAALVLIIFVFFMNLIARLIMRGRPMTRE